MLNWDAIDRVLLDMDGTLLDLHFDTYFWLEHLPRRYAEHHGLAAAAAREHLHSRILQEQGRLNWYCLDYWSAELQLDVAQLKHEICEKIAFRPQVEDFLQTLKAAAIPTLIVTNAHRKSLELKLTRTGLDTYVDDIICSHDFQLPKEDPAFWQQLQAHTPFDPERTLLVDDSLAVLRTARNYGIAHLLSIYQPDSQQPRRQIDEFAAIDHFDQIRPNRSKSPS